MRTRKIAAIIAVVLCISMLFGGCAAKNSSTGAENIKLTGVNEFPIVEEPVTMSAFAVKSAFVENFETNEFTKYYEEKTGVHIDWNVASGEAGQALNLMLASGDYDDILLSAGVNKASSLKYSEEGILVDIKPAIEKYGYYIKEMFEDDPSVEPGITINDAIYGLPRYSNAYSSQYLNAMWVYKPWLEKLNIDIPQNTEEFYQMLNAFKEQDPNGNGIADEIPLTARGAMGDVGIRDYIMSAFIPSGGTGWYHENGEVKIVAVQPEYREGLRYFKRLYDEGLLYSDTFILDRTQITSIGESNPPILGCAAGMWRGMFTVGNGQQQRFYEFTSIPPLEGPTGVRAAVKNKESFYSMFNVTSSCASPELAVKWVDYLFSTEGSLMSRNGVGGVGFREAKEGELGPNGEQAKWVYDVVDTEGTSASSMSQNISWNNFGPLYVSLDNSFHTIDYNHASSKDGETYKHYATYKQYEVDNFLADPAVAPEEAEEYSDIHLNIFNAEQTWFTKFVTGEADIDKDWDEYMSYLESTGLERYLEILQAAFDRSGK